MSSLGAAGCGENNSSPARPSLPVRDPPQVSAYLDELLGLMQAASVNSRTIDWSRARTEVFAAAGAAQAFSDAYPAIETALQTLKDFESNYRGVNGRLIGPAEGDASCTVTPDTPAIPDAIGYVKVRGCPCQGRDADQFAETVQQDIRAADRPGLAGWIVDLRETGGGNMWPMMAGLGPILGEGIMGWIVYNNREYEREYRGGAALSLDEVFASVAVPYTLITSSPKVAVLTSRNTNSAGEAIAVWFRGRPNTRSFGAPTCGHHHLLQTFRMSDGATLTLKNANNADRLKRPYAGPIYPDEIYSDPGESVNRAIAWLLGKG